MYRPDMPWTLLCTCGLTPQVVTETLYALVVEQQRRPPAAIHVVSTRIGIQRVRERLLGRSGALPRLCRDWRLSPRPRCDSGTLHTIRDAGGTELDDIVSAADNLQVGNQIGALVHRLTAQPDHALHVSMAGGRKTMGFYVAYALSLYGREVDSLSHVLVSPEQEQDPDFYYPLPAKEGASSPQVMLADLPFVRLRHIGQTSWLDHALDFNTAVAQRQMLLNEPRLELRGDDQLCLLQGTPVRLSPNNFLWMYWLAQRVQQGAGPARFDAAAGEELLALVTRLFGAGPGKVRSGVETALRDLQRGFTDYFDRARSRLNRAIDDAPGLPPGVGPRYRIVRTGRHGDPTYGLDLQPHQVVLK